MMNYKILITLCLILNVVAGQWDDIKFKKVDESDTRVSIECTETQCEATVEEDFDANTPFLIAQYNGEDLKIATVSPKENLLGIKIEKAAEGYHLIMGIQPDYEALPEKLLGFQFNNDLFFLLTIKNINNKPPVIQTFENPCEIKEEEIVTTECIYTVTDADNMFDELHYTIEQNEEYFEFEKTQEENLATFTLKTKKKLDYETNPILTFKWKVNDGKNDSQTVIIVIQVIDINDQPPVWTKIFSTKEFDEMEKVKFDVLAKDGDISLDEDIHYSIQCEDKIDVTIDRTTGSISAFVDRDEQGKEIFKCQVTAFEENEDFKVTQDILFNVQDINNKIPTITFQSSGAEVDELTLIMDESTKATLPIDYSISVHDQDLGDNALYTVQLEDFGEIKYSEAFQIIPNSGYQKWPFSLSILNNALLDYEDKSWRSFSFKMVSIEGKDASHTDSKTIKVELKDWNDEIPTFTDSSYSIDVNETEQANFEIIKVYAEDAEGAVIEYKLVGTQISRSLSIEKNDDDEGVIKTQVDNAFDFEKLSIVNVQILATEVNTEEHHTGTAELTINVIDVNDETPRISIPNSIFEVAENQNDETVIKDTSIIATDDDAGAIIKLEIIWEESYFTKSGVRASQQIETDYKGCISIKEKQNNKNKIEAELVIVDVVENNTPDFEKFDTIYIKIKVTDTQQTYGTNTNAALLTISVKDVNDNAPKFLDVTINGVEERRTENSLITYILAKDADGEEFNKITYSLIERNDTGPGLVGIDPNDGKLFVAGVIIADTLDGIPGYYWLYYTVTASDGDANHDTHKDIEIEVIDVNNQTPVISKLESTVSIDEGARGGTIVQTISATDADRDAPYNTLKFLLDDDDIKKIFEIDDKGTITVGLEGPKLLDRETKAQYEIAGTVIDNAGVVNGGGTFLKTPFTFTLKLLDVNDESPKIVPTDDEISTTEDVKAGAEITTLHATDNDEAGNDNSKISLIVTSIEAVDDIKKVPQDLFKIEDTIIQSSGDFKLTAGIDLKSYYGAYKVIVKAIDYGEPQLSTTSTLTIKIDKFNFNEPTITYPSNGKVFLLATDQQTNTELQCFIENCIQDFTASDGQGEKWTIRFDIDPVTNPDDIFQMKVMGDRKARLVLTTTDFDMTVQYTLTIVASDNGTPESKSTTISITVIFTDKNPIPIFEENNRNQMVDIHEIEDVNNIFKLPEAKYNYDINNSEIDPNLPKDVFYRIANVEPSKYASAFKVETNSNNVTLIEKLDRETDETVKFNVIAYRTTNDPVQEQSKMLVTVNIIDDNDNDPVFTQNNYYGAIMTSYALQKSIVTIDATDPDASDTLTWSEGSVTTDGDNIGGVDNPFKLNTATGIVALNFKVQPSMNGLFNYEVKVSDSVHEIKTTVKIFIVTNDNRLELKFENTIETVVEKQNEIPPILRNVTGYICSIESISKNTDENGNQVDTSTSVQTYFVDPKKFVPIDAETVQKKLTGISTYNSLKQMLLSKGLYLMKLGDEKVIEDNIEDVLKAWLIGVSVGLGSVCIVLIIIFIIKVRSLTSRISKLTETKFGSQESGLNRIAAPGTNRRAAEGANPVFNTPNTKHDDFDNASINSNDSGLVGVENNADFDIDIHSRKESINPMAFNLEGKI